MEDERGVDALVVIREEVFGGHHSALRAELLDDVEAERVSVTMAGDEPISSGRIEFNEGTEFASLYGGSTLAAWRRRGVFRALVAYRAAPASARGYRYLQTDASDDSRPILERLGFRKLATTTPFIHP